MRVGHTFARLISGLFIPPEFKPKINLVNFGVRISDARTDPNAGQLECIKLPWQADRLPLIPAHSQIILK
jgi:hypothetical protein